MSVFKQSPTSKFYSYRFMRNGRRYSGTCFGCCTAASAQSFEAKIMSAQSEIAAKETIRELFETRIGELVVVNPILVDDAYDRAMRKPQRRSAGNQREAFKRNYWNDFAYFMQCNYPEVQDVQHVTVVHAEEYIARIRRCGNYRTFADCGIEKRYSNNTLNCIHATLFQVFALLKNETGMPNNPFETIPRLPADSDGHEPYTPHELKNIFDKADSWLYPLFMIGLFSGMRMGDICTLKKSEIDFDRGFIVRTQRKTGKMVEIPILPNLAVYMRKLINEYEGCDFLLPIHAEQYKKCPSTIDGRVKKFLENDLGIQTTKNVPGRTRAVNVKGIHSLRHTLCTIAGVVGIPETVLRSILGHMTREMTALYTRHVDDADKMRYMKLFGERIDGILAPRAQRAELVLASHVPLIGTDRERDDLIAMITKMPIEGVRVLARGAQNLYRN